MRHLIRFLSATVLLLVAGTAAAQSGFETLSNPQPTSAPKGEVEVIEFFSYGCPHCFDFEPKITAWADANGERMDLAHVPITFGRDQWKLYARAFYVASALDVLDRTHRAFFEAIHVDGRRFRSPEDVADFYASLGIDRESVIDAFDSFSVSMDMRRGEQMARDYRITSTPSMAVAGRYRVTVTTAGGQQAMLDVVDRLIERTR